MTVKQIEEILKVSKFTDEADREYWVDRLAELKIKEAAAKENEKYFAKNRVYDRFETEMPSRYWEPGCEDVNNEDDQIGELNEFADLEIPFE